MTIPPPPPLSRALTDIVNERFRQIREERYAAEHDDAHDDFSLSKAAACYALGSPEHWPWHPDYWKPKSRRQDLVRAAALLTAEIDRLDRLADAESHS